MATTVRQPKAGLLIDGDILLYRAGFAAEKRVYKPKPGSWLNTHFPHLSWTSAKAAKEELTKLSGLVLKTIDFKTEVMWERSPEAVENAIHNLNSLINTIKLDMLDQFEEVELFIFLTGCGEKPNFREAIDPAYKANRNPKNKPEHLGALKEYLIKNYPTIVTQGCEADDYLAQAQYDMTRIHPDMTPVIVTLDKDLDQIRGYKYNFVDKEYKYVTETEGEIFFFHQMILGDKADNIEGVPGYGPVKTKNLFSSCINIPSYIRKAHQAYIGYYGSLDAAQRAWNKNCDLLWIWRRVPDGCPYKVPEKVSVEELYRFKGHGKTEEDPIPF